MKPHPHSVIISFRTKKVRDEFAKWYAKSGTVHFFGWLNHSGKWGKEYARKMMDEWPEWCEAMQKSTDRQGE